MLITGIIVLIAAAAVYLFMHGPQFGKPPSGERLKKIQQSTHYRDGQFQNISHTPQLTEGASMIGILGQISF